MKSLISPLSLLSLVLSAGVGYAQHDASTSVTADRKLDVYMPPPPPPSVYVSPPTAPPLVYAPPPTPPPLIYAPPPTPPPYLMPIYQTITDRPSTRPSSKPSARPSPAPSRMPSRTPTLNPTVSHAPSRDPSAKPSAAPSAKPSRSAAPSASPSKSSAPSAAPSRSFSPSADPTRSVHPSAEPSHSSRPSAHPSHSAKPSAKPSTRPSSLPSRLPSSRPSTVPSSQPTAERVLTVTFNDLSLTLFGITDLRLADQTVWEDITARFIRNFFSAQEFGLLDLQVSVRIQGQNRRLVSESNLRNLQAATSSVRIRYSQTVEILVASDHIELEKLAFLWLTKQVDRDRYIRRLQRSENTRLSLVTNVTEISGTWSSQTPPTPDGIPVKASLDGPSMRLIGITNLTSADLNRWRLATIDYVEDYIRSRSEAFGVYNFGTDFVGITQTAGFPQVVDAVISYNQTFTFSTSDQSKVPELVQLVSSLPFCRARDRQAYVDQYLRLEGGALVNVVSSEKVQGTDFVCPSPNEVCAGAVPIRANNGTIFGSITSGAGLDANPQCAYDVNAPRAWFALNGTGDVISISTCSSALNFNSAITVSSGSCVNQQCIVASGSNDYDCTLTTSGASKVALRTEIGVTYFIVVEGLQNPTTYPTQGRFGLTVSTLEAPSNDVCTGAVRIRADGRPTFGSITNASSEYGSNNYCYYNYADPSVWYLLIGTGEVVVVTTCSPELNFDSALAVSSGTCNNQQCITSGAYNGFGCTSTFNSAARVMFRTEPGVNYFIVVEAVNGIARGQFALTASAVVPVANDVCTGAVTLQPNSTVLGTITNATGNDNFCTSSPNPANTPSVWYKINGTGAELEFSTCSPELNFASAISVTSGSCANQRCLITSSSNNDPCPVNSFGLSAATVSFRTQVGVTYFIIVEGTDSVAEGVFRLSTRTIQPVPNAVCTSAMTVLPNSTVQGFITNSLGVDRTCTQFSNAPGVWYTMNGTGAVYEITTCSAQLNFESALSISTGTCGDQQCIVRSVANNVACPASPSGYNAARYVLRTVVGVKYFIVVEGLSNPTAGVFDLRVTPVTPPANDLCTDAILIPSNNVTVNGSTALASYSLGTASCSAVTDFQQSQDVWYRVQGTGGFLTASLCNPATTFDSQIAIYAAGTGAQCDQSCIVSNDDACQQLSSQVSWATQLGVNYTIRVYGFGTNFGPFGLRVFPGAVVAPAAEETAEATPVSGEAIDATPESGEAIEATPVSGEVIDGRVKTIEVNIPDSGSKEEKGQPQGP